MKVGYSKSLFNRKTTHLQRFNFTVLNQLKVKTKDSSIHSFKKN